MIAKPSELPNGVTHIVRLLSLEVADLQNPTWYLQGVVTLHNQLLAAAIEEERFDDARTAASYLMAAGTMLLRMLNDV